MDERVTLPLDPETALRALLKVDPDGPTAADVEHDSAAGPEGHGGAEDK
jgi:hypothetical protein